MTQDKIAEISIDDSGRLTVKPSKARFDMIYREAAEVHWDAGGRYLYSPVPREWSHLDWFKHIVETTKILELSPSTIWINVTEEFKEQAAMWMRKRSE